MGASGEYLSQCLTRPLIFFPGIEDAVLCQLPLTDCQRQIEIKFHHSFDEIATAKTDDCQQELPSASILIGITHQATGILAF